MTLPHFYKNADMVSYFLKNRFGIFLVVVLITTCSNSESQQGVISTKDLSTQTTTTTIMEEAEEETISSEDAQLLLARCLRDYGYDVQDPKNSEGLRSVLTPIFIAADEKERRELFETIQICAQEITFHLATTQTLRIQKMWQTD